MSIETKIEKIFRFVSYNKELIASSCSPENLKNQGVNAKIILCSVIDSLAKSRFPDIEQNRKRFIQTTEECANWSDVNRVSLLHLKRAMEITPNLPQAFSKLRAYTDQLVKQRLPLENLSFLNRISINNDPHFADLLALWPSDESGKLLKLGCIEAQKLTHKSLLWQYRNSLVHEYRIPGRAMELGSPQDEPFYQKVSQIREGSSPYEITYTNSWELLYPTGFFRLIAEQILDNVAEFHLSNYTSPFKSYSEGTYWIPMFND